MMRIDWVAIEMILSLQFWRMAVYWTLTLLYCYLRLLIATVFHRLPPPMPRVGCSFSPDSSGGSVNRPICIITGEFEPLLFYHKRRLLSGVLFRHFLFGIRTDCTFCNIGNVGIGGCSCEGTDRGGLSCASRMIQTNYVSAVVLTNILLPLIKNSPTPARIVNVTSFTHHCVCLLVFSFELHGRLYEENPSPNISVIAKELHAGNSFMPFPAGFWSSNLLAHSAIA